jgi:hypothetical protein
VIRVKKGSSYSKILAINLSVTQGMLHKGTHSVWLQKAIAKLEVHISRMIRVALKLPSTYSAALSYAKTGGLGIKSFSQMHREGTKRVTARCLYGLEPGTSAARGIANRAFRSRKRPKTRPGDSYIQPLQGRHVHANATQPRGQRAGRLAPPRKTPRPAARTHRGSPPGTITGLL